MGRGAMGRRKRMPFRATLPLVLAACYITREISDTFVPAPQMTSSKLSSLPGITAALVPSAALAVQEMPPAPSGINTLPESQQAAVVVGVFVGLAAGTAILAGPIFQFLQNLLPEGWWKGWQKTWPILGAFYLAAGVAHFTAAESFQAIYPPEGTWGFWYLPGSASFHVAWTGVAEIAGGTGLFVGALLLGLAGGLQMEVPMWLQLIPSWSALGLFLLTWAVTPANVYMYTHGAQMIGLTPGDQPIPLEFHLIRGLFQVILLSILWSYSSAQREEAQAAS